MDNYSDVVVTCISHFVFKQKDLEQGHMPIMNSIAISLPPNAFKVPPLAASALYGTINTGALVTDWRRTPDHKGISLRTPWRRGKSLPPFLKEALSVK